VLSLDFKNYERSVTYDPYCRNTYSDGFDLNSTALCSICNGDHKEKTLSNTISGEWGSGNYYGETTYRLKCWNGFNKGIQINSNSKSIDVVPKGPVTSGMYHLLS
jgi:hypothetical protein